MLDVFVFLRLVTGRTFFFVNKCSYCTQRGSKRRISKRFGLISKSVADMINIMQPISLAVVVLSKNENTCRWALPTKNVTSTGSCSRASGTSPKPIARGYTGFPVLPSSSCPLLPLPASPSAPRPPFRPTPTGAERWYKYSPNRHRRPQHTHHRALLPLLPLDSFNSRHHPNSSRSSSSQ
jgi:hypothetical protein